MADAKMKLRFGMEWDDKYYAEDIHCENCHQREQLLIPKGRRKPGGTNND